MVFFPPPVNEDDVPPVASIEVPLSPGHACCHNLDDLSCNSDSNNIMTNVNTAKKSLQSLPALSQFWERYDGRDWSNLASSNEKLAASITAFVAISKDVINFPDCQDVRRLLVPLFVTKAPEANGNPRSLAHAVMEVYGLKKKCEDASLSLSSSATTIKDEKPSKSVLAIKKEKGKGAKMRNFTKEEDLFLSRAYVRVSLDPIRGNDQKSQDFWGHVYRTFLTLYKAEAEVQEEDMSGRTSDSIKSRFQRNIQKDVIEFCAICTTELMRSGESQEDFLGRMDLIFAQRKNKPFRFRHCLPVLREIPKFDWETRDNSNADDVADDFLDNAEVEVLVVDKERTLNEKNNRKSSFMNNASALKRPQGTKAAKRKVVEEYLDGKTEDKKIRILQDVASGLSGMADAIQKKQHREHLQSMLMIYQSLGNQEKMQEYLMKLEALTIETFPARPVHGNTEPHVTNRTSSPTSATTLPNVDSDTPRSTSSDDGAVVIDDTQSESAAKDDIARELDKELDRIIRESQEHDQL